MTASRTAKASLTELVRVLSTHCTITIPLHYHHIDCYLAPSSCALRLLSRMRALHISHTSLP